MAIEVVPLDEAHLKDAAALAASRYRGLRQEVPFLPRQYAEVDILLPMVHKVAGAGPGVVAMHGGRLVGFLSGWLIPSFRGRRTAFSPEWANGAEPRHSRRIYEEM
jgi:hypothetical protein